MHFLWTVQLYAYSNYKDFIYIFILKNRPRNMSESKRKDVIEDDTKKYFKDSNEINKKLKTENSTRDQSNKVNKIQLSLSSSISTVCIELWKDVFSFLAVFLAIY